MWNNFIHFWEKNSSNYLCDFWAECGYMKWLAKNTKSHHVGISKGSEKEKGIWKLSAFLSERVSAVIYSSPEVQREPSQNGCTLSVHVNETAGLYHNCTDRCTIRARLLPPLWLQCCAQCERFVWSTNLQHCSSSELFLLKFHCKCTPLMHRLPILSNDAFCLILVMFPKGVDQKQIFCKVFFPLPSHVVFHSLTKQAKEIYLVCSPFKAAILDCM